METAKPYLFSNDFNQASELEPEPIGKLRARGTIIGPDFCDSMKE